MSKFAPISVLYNDIIRVVKGSIGWILVVSILSLLATVLVTLTAGVLMGLLNMPIIARLVQLADSPLKESPLPFLAELSPFFWISLIVLGCLWVLALMIISLVQAGVIVLVTDAVYRRAAVSLTLFIQQAFSRARTLWWTSMVVVFLVFGGTMLLLIPGFIFQLLFAFVTYEVVLNNQSLRGALRESARVVKPNFFPILGRNLLLFFTVIVISFVVNLFSSVLDPEQSGLSVLLDMIMQIVLAVGMYSASLVIYHQAKQAAEGAPTPTLKPVLALAIVGWLVGVLLIVAIGMQLVRVADKYNQSPATSSMDNTPFEQTGAAYEEMLNAVDETTMFPEGMTEAEKKAYLKEYEQLMQQVESMKEQGTMPSAPPRMLQQR